MTKEASKQKESVNIDGKKPDNRPFFRPGDTIKVFYKIVEGEKERIQPFEGVVLAKKGGGVSETFTVRKIGAGGIGVERIFPNLSPNIEKVEIIKKGLTKRAKLYYLRSRTGRAALKVKEKKA